MNITTVTTWNDRLYQQYAHRFMDTYNWDFPLNVYNEDVDMYNIIPQCRDFVEKWSHIQPSNYRYDAVRFCYKVYAYTHEILSSHGKVDGIIFVDADSVFHNPIDSSWIKEHIHRDDCITTYLGRGDEYTECGFIYFNMRHPSIINFAKRIQYEYNSGSIFTRPEWHDCIAFDYVRKMFEADGIKSYNIGDDQWGENGHVQARSILGTIYDHTKGPRKVAGISPENALLSARNSI